MPAVATSSQRSTKLPIGCSEHERGVARIARRIFDALADDHRLPTAYRTLLGTACLVHDAAKSAGDADHHVTGARLVLDTADLPLDPWQRRAVAFLVRYHKGRVADPGHEEILLAGDGRRKLRILLAILRAADSLHIRGARAAVAITRRPGRLRISYLTRATDLGRVQAKLRRKAKFELLEQSFALEVRLRLFGINLGDLA